MAVGDPIRPIAQRLNTTPVQDLPRYAAFLASSVLNCAESVQRTDDQQGEVSVQLHKLITRVTSLLQDKTQEGRYTGIVLAKALVEAGGVQRLTISGSTWLRALLSCVNKHDPPEVKKLAIYTITRIFLLTREHQSLVRELTTPNLPPFVNACLNTIRPAAVTHGEPNTQLSSPLLGSVFQCWRELLTAFPSTFRPFVPSIRTILVTTLSDQTAPSTLLEITTQTFATLHFCASKDSVASEWLQSCQHTIRAAHQVADLVFRSVIEDWSTNGSYQPSTGISKKVTSQVKAQTDDAMGLGKWSGIQAGCFRAVVLVDLLARLLTAPHAQAVRVPLAEILDMSARFAAVVKPTKTYALRENKEISRDERDDLFMSLPKLHCAIIDLHRSLIATFGQLLTPVVPILLIQIWEIFESEQSDQDVRSSVYAAMTEVLKHSATCLASQDSERLATLIRLCCNDLGSCDGEASKYSAHADMQNGDLNLNGRQRHQSLGIDITKQQTSVPKLHKAAWDLIPIILSRVPQTLIPSKARANIDRSIILVGHQEAMLASVLNPLPIRHGAEYTSSILPFLARSSQQSSACEALIRPRQPVLPISTSSVTEAAEQEIELAASQQATPTKFSSTQYVEAEEERNIDTPSGQLDGELLSQVARDASMVKKREHEWSTGLENYDPEVPSKKAKLHRESPKASTEKVTAATSSDVPKSNGQSLRVAGVDSRISAPTPVDQAKGGEDAMAFPVPPPPGQNVRRPTDEQDDDSDDSEIPVIDATLSSDDEETDE